MSDKRDAYKYHFIVGGKIVYRGVTSDLERAEKEHQVRWPDGRIVQVGNRTTWTQAQAWASEGGKSASQSANLI